MNKVEIILNRLNKVHGISRSQLVDLLNISDQAISNWIGRNSFSKKAKRSLILDHKIPESVFSDLSLGTNIEQQVIEPQIEYFQTKNNDFQIINGRIYMKVFKVPMKAHAQYVDEFYSENVKDVSFEMEWVAVDNFGKGEYKYFEVQGDSMDGDLKINTPEGALVLAREIGVHLWKSGLYKSKFGHIIITNRNILFKDIIKVDYNNMIATLHSRNTDKEKYPDFNLALGYRNDQDYIQQIFKVIKRDNM